MIKQRCKTYLKYKVTRTEVARKYYCDIRNALNNAINNEKNHITSTVCKPA